MEDKELYNPQNGEVIKAKRPKQFWKDWRFYVYTMIAIMLAIVSFSSCLTACAAINAGIGQNEDASYSFAQRKNAVITTDGGYSGYTFTLTTDYPATNGEWNGFVYLVDSNFDLEEYGTYTGSLSSQTWAEEVDVINEVYEYGVGYATSNTNTRFMVAWYAYASPWGDTTTPYYLTYLSFVPPNYTSSVSGESNLVLDFIAPNWGQPYAKSLDYNWRTIYGAHAQQVLSNTKNDHYTYSTASSSSIVFQDVASYYQELGYQSGYDVGSSDGYVNGHSAGYNEGYASGNANGYASGYEQATQDYQTGIAFTSYGLYANAQLTLTTDEVIGNYSYMYLFKYVTSNYDEHTVYVLFTQNSSTSQYLGYVLDRNDSDDSTSAVTIGSFSAQSSLAVTITAEQDQYFELYTGFVTSFFDRGSEVIEAVWFSGGTSQTALQNYQDGYDTGYQDGVSAGYGSGYDAGYRVGEVAGINQAEPEALTNTLVAVFQQPFNQIYRFFNFNILGLNVLGLATGLLSVFIIIKVFKKVLK